MYFNRDRTHSFKSDVLGNPDAGGACESRLHQHSSQVHPQSTRPMQSILVCQLVARGSLLYNCTLHIRATQRLIDSVHL